MKSYLKKFGFVFLIICGLANEAKSDTYDWIGVVSTDVTEARNWARLGGIIGLNCPVVPSSTDDVRIGVATSYLPTIVQLGGICVNLLSSNITSTNSPNIPTGKNIVWNSVTFGFNSIRTTYTNPITGTNTAYKTTLTLTGTATLSVGSVTINHFISAQGSANNFANITILGTGTLTCNGDFTVGDLTNLPAPQVAVVAQASIQVNQLTINGNINLIATGNNTAAPAANSGLAYPWFSVEKGKTTLAGQMKFSQSNQAVLDAVYARNGNKAGYQGYGKFTADNTLTSPNTLELLNKQSIALPFVDGFYVYFTAGGANGTVIYNDPNAADNQTIYTANEPSATATSTFINTTLVSPVSYNNLTFSGASTKLIDKNSSIGTGTQGLTIGGNWSSTGGKIDAIFNNPTVVFQSAVAQTLSDVASNSGAGVVFKNVNFQGGGTKTVSAGNFAVSSTGVLTMIAPSSILSVGTGGSLTLNSDASSSASVAQIPTGSSILGNVNVQRFVLGNNSLTRRQYRMLTSPIHTNASGTNVFNFNYIKASSYITGPGGTANGFDKDTNPTIYIYREDYLTDPSRFSAGPYKGLTKITPGSNQVDVVLFTTVPGGSETVTVPIGNGFIYYFIGNRTNLAGKTTPPVTPPEDVTYTNTGVLNQGPVSVLYWHNQTTSLPFTDASHGLFLTGNPYASSINWDTFSNSTSTAGVFALGLTGGNNATIWVLDPLKKTYDTYQAHTGGAGTGNASNIIASGQGFLVQSTSAGKALTFNETAKVLTQPTVATDPNNHLLMDAPPIRHGGFNTNVSSNFMQSVSTSAVKTFQYLRLRLQQDSIYSDEVILQLDSNAKETFSTNEDAEDLGGVGAPVDLSALSSDKVATSINWLPLDKKTTHIKLTANATKTGNYALIAREIVNIPTTYDIWLKDNYKKDSIDYRLNNQYLFNIDRSIPDTYAPGRFELVINKKPLPPYKLVNFKADRVSEGIKVVWTTENEFDAYGFVLQKQDASNQFVDIWKLQSDGKNLYTYIERTPSTGINSYRLKQLNTDQQISYSSIVTVDYNIAKTISNVFSIYPNPAKSQITVHLNQTLSKGDAKIQVRIYSSTGSLIQNSIINGNEIQQDVSHLLPGTYIVEVLNQNSGRSEGIQKFVKQ